jgi:hypothetical protein
MVPPKPIIAIGEYWKGVVNNLNSEEILNSETRQRFNITKCSELVTFANDIEEAAKMISDRI